MKSLRERFWAKTRQVTQKRLVESDKLWWGMYGLFILVWMLAIAIESVALGVAAILIAMVLAILTWRKYGESRPSD